MFTRSTLHVYGLQLADGDILRYGNRRLQIVDIRQPALDLRRGMQRKALVIINNTGKPVPFTFDGFSLRHLEVIGGPKLKATQQNPALIKWMPAGYWLWEG